MLKRLSPQELKVYEYIKRHGFITTMTCATVLHIVDLQGRIQQMEKKGFCFAKTYVYTEDGVKYKRYAIEEEPEWLMSNG